MQTGTGVHATLDRGVWHWRECKTPRPIDLSRAEQTSEMFRQIHPGAQVPVLLIDGLTLSQSLPILEFLDERFADRGVRLLPDRADQRFAAREIAAFVASFIQRFQLPGVTRRRMVDAFGLATHELGTEGACRRSPSYISRPPFPSLTGWFHDGRERFASATPPASPTAWCFPQLIATVSFGVDVKACRTLSRVHEECMRLPAFADSLPERQVDALKAA